MSTYYFTKPAKTARDARIKHEALALRALHHKHAAKAARLAHLLHMVSKHLLNLHKKIHKDAIAIVGEYYKTIIKSASTSMVPWPIRPRTAIYPPVRASSIRRAPWPPTRATRPRLRCHDSIRKL